MDWTQKPRLVKHGLDSFSKTSTGLKSARLVKHGLDSFSKTGLDSFSKTWTGLKSARLVKHGLKTGNYFKRAMWGGEGGGDIRSTYNKQSQINYWFPSAFSFPFLAFLYLLELVYWRSISMFPRIFNVNMNHWYKRSLRVNEVNKYTISICLLYLHILPSLYL